MKAALSKAGWAFALVALGVVGTLWLTDRDPGHTASSIITVAAALAIGLLTIITTDRRQDRQLAHQAAESQRQREAETKRHEQSLQAERERQRDRLQHDRDMRAREEMITLFDDALKAIRVAENFYDAYKTAWKDGVETFDSNDPRDMESGAELLAAALSRLVVRFGPDAELLKAVVDLTDAATLYGDVLNGFSSEPWDQNAAEVDGASVALSRAGLEFVLMASRKVQSFQLGGG